jgi:hypothetical protein
MIFVMTSAMATDPAKTALPVMTRVTRNVSTLPVVRQLIAFAIDRKCDSLLPVRESLEWVRVGNRNQRRHRANLLSSRPTVWTNPIPTVS